MEVECVASSIHYDKLLQFQLRVQQYPIMQ